MGRGETGLNAVIGAVVTVALSFTIFSPVLGGAVASYLQGEDTAAGVRVGALSGVLAAIPFLAFVLFFVGFLAIGPAMGGLPGGFVILFLVGLVFAAAWNVGLGAFGGYLGVYIATETDLGN